MIVLGLVAGSVVIAIAVVATVLGSESSPGGGVAPTTSTNQPQASSTAPSASLPPQTSTASSSASPAAVALPSAPPPTPDCQGGVKAHQDIPHPYLGTVRLFLILKQSDIPNLRGCVSGVASNGKVLPVITIDAENSQDGLNFAYPLTDSTGNAFITYNPGRYNGVLVLIPTPDGFQNIGWDTADVHYMGKLAYYYANLQGPGPDGKYTIIQYHNDCSPSCAGGNITSQTLQWNGTNYAP
jgi:hypothetical protein